MTTATLRMFTKSLFRRVHITSLFTYLLAFTIAFAPITQLQHAHAENNPTQSGNEIAQDEVITGQAPEVSAETDAREYDLTLTFKNGTIYELTGAPYSSDNLNSFRSLSEEEQKKFLARRELYLSKVASLLHYTKLIYGTGSIAFNKVKQVAAPTVSVLKSTAVAFFDKSKNLLLIAGNAIKKIIAKIKPTPAESSVNTEVVQALSVPEKAFKFAKSIIRESNQKLQKFNSWLLTKIYGKHPFAELAPPIQELAASVEINADELAVTTTAGAAADSSPVQPAPEANSAQPEANSVPANSILKRIKERGTQIVGNLLEQLDRLLWEQSRLIVAHNEVVVFLSVSLTGMSGVQSAVSGSAPHTLGLKLGMNWDSKALVFEIYHETEKMIYATTPTSEYGLVPKVGVALLAQYKDDMQTREGTYMYPTAPPGMPFAPSFTAILKDQFEIGYSTGAITVPFSLLSDFFWYYTAAAQRPLVRVTISPKTLGFIRMKFISFRKSKNSDPSNLDFSQPVQMVADAIEKAAAQKEKSQHNKQSSCSDIIKRADSSS